MSEKDASFLLHINNVYSTNPYIYSYSWPDYLYYPFFPYVKIFGLTVGSLLFRISTILVISWQAIRLKKEASLALLAFITIPIIFQQLSSFSLDSIAIFCLIQIIFFKGSLYLIPIASMIKPYFIGLILIYQDKLKLQKLFIIFVLSLLLISIVLYLNYLNYGIKVKSDFNYLNNFIMYIKNIYNLKLDWLPQIYGTLGYNLSIKFPRYIYIFSGVQLSCVILIFLITESSEKILPIFLLLVFLLVSFFYIYPTGLGFQGRYLTPFFGILFHHLAIRKDHYIGYLFYIIIITNLISFTILIFNHC